MHDLLVNIVASFIWALLAGVAAWLWQQRKIRRLRERLRAFEAERGSCEVALVLSAREDILEAVRAHLTREGLADVPVFHRHKPGSFSETEADWMSFVREIKDLSRQIREHGASRVYLFTNVPVVMGVFAGAILDNGPEVVVHHYFSGTYRRVGSLTHETVNL